MNSVKNLAASLAVLFLLQLSAWAQAPFMFLMTFRGTCYQTNTSGQFVATPITDASLLKDAAAAGGRTDTSGMALVYHVQGSSFGDTIDVVNSSNGSVYTTLYGLFFGDDSVQSLGRTALTNSPGTEVRRLDYIYTSQNSHSMGSCFTAKRFLQDSQGHVHTTITGQMQWIVNPQNNAGTKVCTGTFVTTKPLF